MTEKERGQHILNMQERAGFRRWLARMPMRIITLREMRGYGDIFAMCLYVVVQD